MNKLKKKEKDKNINYHSNTEKKLQKSRTSILQIVVSNKGRENIFNRRK